MLRAYYSILTGVPSGLTPADVRIGAFTIYRNPIINGTGVTVPTADVYGTPQMFMDFAPKESFQTIPFEKVYHDDFDPSLIRDHIILIGATATAMEDFKYTPIGIMPGVYLHANIINTVLK